MRKIVILFSMFVFFLLTALNVGAKTSQMIEIYNLSDTTYKSLYDDWKVKKGNITLSESGIITGSADNAAMFYSQPLCNNFEVEINSFKTYYNGGKIFFNVCSDEYNSGIKDGYAISWKNQNSANIYTFKLSKYVDYKVEKEWEPLEFKRDKFDYSNSFKIAYRDGEITFTVISTNDSSCTAEKTFDLYENDNSPFCEGYIGLGGGSEYFVLNGISIKEEQQFVINPVDVKVNAGEVSYLLNTINYTDNDSGVIVTVLYDAAGKTLGTDVVTQHSFEYGELVQLSGKISIPKGYIPSHITTYAFKNNYVFLGKNSTDYPVQ